MAPPNPKPAMPNKSDSGGLLVVVGFILLLIYGLSQCDSDAPESNAMAMMNTSNVEMGNAIAAQPPPPILELSEQSVRRGASHLRIAFEAEGFPGAMVYSQNCYDALAREFSWAKLDQCGGFDMLAVRSVDSATNFIPTGELNYFHSEAAAGRYLAAATAAGQPGGDADTRLSNLQARTALDRTVSAPEPEQPKEADANALDDATSELWFVDPSNDMASED